MWYEKCCMDALTRLFENPIAVLWPQRRPALLGLAAGLALAVLLCVTLPEKWTAHMVTGPAGRGAGPDLSAFLPASESPTIQYLLQRVGAVTAADFSVYEMLLTSPRVAGALQKDETLKTRLSEICRTCATDEAALARWLDRNVRVRPVAATQMRRVSICLGDRALATDLLRALHRLADETIRMDVRIRTDRRIDYLRAQLGQVVNLEQRDALIGLLKEQERTRMMVGIDNDFAAEMIDPPSLAARPSFPDPYILLPLLGLAGAACGAGAGLYRAARRA